MVVLYYSSDGVVCPADPTFGLELDIGGKAKFGTPYDAVVSEFLLHVAE